MAISNTQHPNVSSVSSLYASYKVKSKSHLPKTSHFSHVQLKSSFNFYKNTHDKNVYLTVVNNPKRIQNYIIVNVYNMV